MRPRLLPLLGLAAALLAFPAQAEEPAKKPVGDDEMAIVFFHNACLKSGGDKEKLAERMKDGVESKQAGPVPQEVLGTLLPAGGADASWQVTNPLSGQKYYVVLDKEKTCSLSLSSRDTALLRERYKRFIEFLASDTGATVMLELPPASPAGMQTDYFHLKITGMASGPRFSLLTPEKGVSSLSTMKVEPAQPFDGPAALLPNL